MSRNYKFRNPNGLYFISFAVVGWLDVFIRNEYKDLFIESLVYCQKEKGLEIHAWCIMTNHIHLVFRSIKGQKPELLIGDLKRFTSNSIVRTIQENPKESRKEFLLEFFKNEAKKSSNVKHYQFWRHDNNPIELWSNKVIKQDRKSTRLNSSHVKISYAVFCLKKKKKKRAGILHSTTKQKRTWL